MEPATVILLLAACSSSPGLPLGSWVLEGHGALGELRVEEKGALIGLWGDSWGTPAEAVPARIIPDEQGAIWLHFSFVTGTGEGEAVLQADPELQRAFLPLGARKGELELVLAMQAGTMEAQRRTRAQAQLAAGLAQRQQAWRDGRFRLLDEDGTLLGGLQLLPEKRANVEFFSAGLLTEGPVAAGRRSDGPDLLLQFAVQPSFDDEPGLLRLNLPTMRAVLPMASRPHPDDRWLGVSPGWFTEEERAERLTAARREALLQERSVLSRLAPALSAAALQARTAAEDGACPGIEELGETWTTLLADYRVRLEATAGDCVVLLEPKTIQHGRRIALRATAAGILEQEVLE